MPLTDVLQARPDWLELLSLPVGSLVVVDGGAVAAVINTQGVDRWAELNDAKLNEALQPPAEAAVDSPTEPSARDASADTPAEAAAVATESLAGESDGRA